MSFVGDIVSSLISADATKDATASQEQSAREANALQRYMFDTQRNDTEPYRKAGATALTQIQALLKSPNSIRNSADYKFGLGEGVNALENSATARGMTYSGAQTKALQRFGQNYAGTKLDQTFNRLASVAGLGQTGVGQAGAAGGAYANNVGNNLMGVGNAQAANALARGSAYGNAINSAIAYGDRAGWFNMQRPSFGPQLDPFFSGTGGSGD
jgi:hypothetical protein